jgi:hypothetical protein
MGTPERLQQSCRVQSIDNYKMTAEPDEECDLNDEKGYCCLHLTEEAPFATGQEYEDYLKAQARKYAEEDE